MEPFKTTLLDNKALESYPDPHTFLSAIDLLTDGEVSPYLRLQLLEGVPFFLRAQPLTYELIREWLSNQLSISPRDIIVIGSSSIGFSMAPPPDFGKSYSENSDTDFSIVSEYLFGELEAEFSQWGNDYIKGTEVPTKAEETFWKQNSIVVARNISKGFVDTYKIPNRYKNTMNVNDALYRLDEKMKLSFNKTYSFKVSARVYKNWKCFTNQFRLNLNHAVSQLDERHRALLLVKSQ